jgi:hypothetical protein
MFAFIMMSMMTISLGAATTTSYHEALELPSLDFQNQFNIKILQIALPHHEIKSLKKEKRLIPRSLLVTLESLEDTLSKDKEIPPLKELVKATELAGDLHFQSFINELIEGSYEASSIREYLGWYVKLTLTHLKGESSQLKEKTQQFYQKILGENYDIQLRDSYGHSPSFFLIDQKTKQPFAILKQSNPEFYSSFKQHLPNMPLSAPVWEHELIGFEQDQLFGFNHTPTTLAVRFQNQDNEIVNGIIQEFIHSSKAGVDFYDPEGADLLKAIPKIHVHALALSGFFKGISAGHMSNYILQLQENSVKAIVEVDLEEILLPYNRLSELSDSLALGITESLILCRMWILGLPQSDQPFDRAALILMSHPSFLSLIQHYHTSAREYSRIDEESWQAQYKRVKLMQEACKDALGEQDISFTPRDLYFLLFGGKHLWKMAQEKQYPSILAFNHLISDPYQHILKDFAHPDSIPSFNQLEEPLETTQESIDLLNFYRKMSNLEAKSF